MDNENENDSESLRLYIVPICSDDGQSPVGNTIFTMTPGDFFSKGISKIRTAGDNLPNELFETEFGKQYLTTLTSMVSSFSIIPWTTELDTIVSDTATTSTSVLASNITDHHADSMVRSRNSKLPVETRPRTQAVARQST